MPKYRVQGICLVPCEAVIEIDAENPDEAMRKAQQAWSHDKSCLVTQNGYDTGAAFD